MTEPSHRVSSPELTVLAQQRLFGKENSPPFSHMSAMIVKISVLTVVVQFAVAAVKGDLEEVQCH
jgi:hypothetical protein